MPPNCRRCDRALFPRAATGTPQRQRAAEGRFILGEQVKHARRGLCETCYRTVREAGQIGDYPALPKPGGRPPGTVVEDFTFIAETSGGRRANNIIGWDRATRCRGAERLGINVDTLDRALYRDAEKRAA